MIDFDWPWLFLVLPLPWLLRHLLPPVHHPPSVAVRVPFFDAVRAASALPASPGGRRTQQSTLMILVWLALVTAAAKPEYVAEAVQTQVSGRDLVLAVDISGSMGEDDFSADGQRVSRLEVVKRVASEFIERRAGDRLGLVLFGERAYLQTPLTFDRETVAAMLDEASVGLAGRRTAIGDAIGLGLKRMRQAQQSQRVMVLLTDGANTAGEVSPQRAAELASRDGLRIYTIGIGSRQRVDTLFGLAGLTPASNLDESSLQAIAQATGGRYFRAFDTEALENIYRELDRLEPVMVEDELLRPTRPLYYWPLAFALALTAWLALTHMHWRGSAAPAEADPA